MYEFPLLSAFFLFFSQLIMTVHAKLVIGPNSSMSELHSAGGLSTLSLIIFKQTNYRLIESSIKKLQTGYCCEEKIIVIEFAVWCKPVAHFTKNLKV